MLRSLKINKFEKSCIHFQRVISHMPSRDRVFVARLWDIVQSAEIISDFISCSHDANKFVIS